MKVPVFALCLSPGLRLIWKGFNGGLGANPIEFITHSTGDWTLRFLAITLAVTPLRKRLRLPELVRFRRMLGLFAFSYACLHFMTYLWLDKFFAWSEITKDVVKRPFITAGFSGSIDSAYQANMWLSTLAQLTRPAMIIMRERGLVPLLGRTGLPVVCTNL